MKNNTLPKNFDWKFYLESYPDLTNAGINDEKGAISHYLRHGYKENRVYKNSIITEEPDTDYFTLDNEINVTLSGFLDKSEGLGQIIYSIEKLIINNNLKYNIIETNRKIETNLSLIEPTEKKIQKLGKIHISFNFAFEIPPKIGNLNFIYSMYEADRIHELWVYNINNNYDGVLVPDEWVKELYINSGVVKPIYVVKIGYNFDFQSLNKKDNDVFTFGLNASYEERKNHEQVIQSFVELYGNNSKYKLKIRGKHGHTYFELLEKYKQINNIEFKIGSISHEELNDWYYTLDCYILISKGEGYSLTPRESIIREIPTIVSNCTAHKTLIQSGGILGIDPIGVEPSYKKGIFNQYLGNQFCFNTIDIKTKMSEVINNYQLHKELVKKSKKWLIDNENINKLSEDFFNFYNTEIRKKRFGIVTSWNTPCGIANYGKYLLEHIEDCKIFTNLNEIIIDSKSEKNVFRCFNVKTNINSLIKKIKTENITDLIINYHCIFFNNENLIKLLTFTQENNINTVCIIHNTSTIDDETFKKMSKIKGVLVHTENEVDRIKSLVSNCFLFEHPIKIPEFVDTKFDFKGKKLFSNNGFLLKDKNILKLIKIFKHINDYDKNTHLLLLNSIHPHMPHDENMEIINEINKYITSVNLTDNVTMINDYLSDEELFSRLSKSDYIIYVREKTTESSSASIRTGLSTGVPVICTENKIYNDVSDYVHFIKNEEPEKMSKSIIEIINDKNLINVKINKQKKWITENTWEKGASKILKILKI